MQIYAARNSFSGVLGYIFWKLFRHLSAKGAKVWPKVWSAKGKGLKVRDTHPYRIVHYIGVSPSVGGGGAFLRLFN